MKTLHRFSLLLCLFATLSFAACGDDDTDPNEDVNNRLEGDWKVESFEARGVELMGNGVTSFDMEYDKQGPTTGEAEWTIIYSDGRTDRTEGDYEIENEGQEIDFDGDDFDIEIDGDDLELEGTIFIQGEGNVNVTIEAERD